MTSRELPPAEWGKLAGTPLGDVAPLLKPACCRVLVVEDGHGRVVGQWLVLPVWHAEALWIDPSHRKGVAVARRLWTLAQRVVRAVGATHVFTAAETPEIAALLDRHAGVALAGTHYMLPVGESTCRLDLCRR